MALVVHGVVASPSAGPSPTPSGDDLSPPVRLVPHGALAGIVSPTEQTVLLPAREDLLRHTRVLEAMATDMTVLPMRFGVVVDDDEALVRTLLAPNHDTFVGRLAHLRGHVEWRLRGSYDEDRVLRELVAADPRLRGLASRADMASRLAVGEHVLEGIAARRRVDAALVIDTVRRHATDVTIADVRGPLEAFSMSALVHEDHREAFDAAIDQLAQRDLGPLTSIEVVGPMPPFSFVEEVV